MTLSGANVLPRSFLYVPADKPELFPKATGGEADALILDLEDAVPLNRKDQARTALQGWLGTENAGRRIRGQSSGGTAVPQCWVRISAESIAADIRSVMDVGLAGVFLAKCTPSSLQHASTILAELEASRGLIHNSIPIIGLIEGADALLKIDAMTLCERLVTFAVGEVDLMADLRMKRGANSEPALDSLRLRIVISCAAGKLAPPVAPTSTAIREHAAFLQSIYKIHALGFRSRTAIHPSQLSAIHEVFTPNPAAVEAARDVMNRFQQSGGGIAMD